MEQFIDKNKIYVISVISFLMFTFCYIFWREFTAIVGAFLFSTLGLLLIHFIDDKMLGNVNTYDEIVNKKNWAYSIYFFSIVYGVVHLAGKAIDVFYSMR